MAPELLHYEIEQRLGSSGAGELYAAKDLKNHRNVTLKAISTDRPIDVDRFEADRDRLARLDHPGIVVPYAVESDGKGHFLAMQEVDGTSLGFNIPDQGMALNRLIELAYQLVDATAAAHRAGVVHRDLKPSNVLIDRQGRVRILGFGISQPIEVKIDEEKEDTATITEMSSVSGMVPYTSPEALRGAPGDFRSDIFSLGVLLYQMACGRRPFRGTSSVEVLVAIVKDDPPPLRDRRRDLPAELGDLIDKCLEKDPDRRFSSTEDLANALHNLVQRDKPSSMEIPIGELLRGPLSPRRWWLRAALAAGLVALTFSGFHWLGPGSDAEERDRQLVAVLPFESQGDAPDSYFALGMTEEIVSRLTSVEELGVIARSSVETFTDSGKSPAQIGRELGADFVLTGTVRWDTSPRGKKVRVTPRLLKTVNAEQVWATSYERVLEDLFSVQNEIAVHVIDQLNITLFPSERRALEVRPTQNIEAYQAYIEGQEKAAYTDDFQIQLEAAELLERAVELDPSFVEGWSQLAWTHAQIYHFGFDRSDDRRRSAEQAIEQALTLDQTSPEARLAKANVLYWTQRDYRGALRELALARRRAPNDSRMIEAEGFILRRLGHMEDALEKLGDASRLDPVDSSLKREIGSTYFLLHRYHEALPFYEQAIGLTENPLHAQLYKARTLWALGRMEEAGEVFAGLTDQDSPLAVWFQTWHFLYSDDFETALSRVRSTDEEVFQWTTWFRPFALLEARILMWMGRSDEATAAFERALEIIDKRWAGSSEEPRLLAARGLTLTGLGRTEEALRAARLASELLPLEADVVAGSSFRLQLAETLAAAGETDAALEELELLLSIPSELSPAVVRVDPRWSPLENDRRFRALVADSSRRRLR